MWIAQPPHGLLNGLMVCSMAPRNAQHSHELLNGSTDCSTAIRKFNGPWNDQHPIN